MADATHRDARPPLLLFPGLLCDARLWRDPVAALCDTVRCAVADRTQDDTLDGMTQRASCAMVPMERPDAATRLMREWLAAIIPSKRRPQ